LVALLLLLLLAGGLHATIGVHETNISQRPQELRDGGDDGNDTDGDPWQDDDKGDPNGSSIHRRFIIIGTSSNPFSFLNAWFVRANSELKIQSSTSIKAPVYHRGRSSTK
jgi:hypothetical protein